jgi:hypothetical protein
MLDEADDGLSCVFASALRAVPWTQFGQKITLSEKSQQDEQWILKGLFEHPDSVQTRIHRIIIVANICSNSGKRKDE